MKQGVACAIRSLRPRREPSVGETASSSTVSHPSLDRTSAMSASASRRRWSCQPAASTSGPSTPGPCSCRRRVRCGSAAPRCVGVPSTKATRRGRVHVGRRVRHERPPSSTSPALDGVWRVVRRRPRSRWHRRPRHRKYRSGLPPQWGSCIRSRAMCAPGLDAWRAYDDAVTDHDTEKLLCGAALRAARQRGPP